jgi:hypothetical protein
MIYNIVIDMRPASSKGCGREGKFVTKKSPGPLYGPGVTSGRILSIIFNNPDGIEEGGIRDLIREKYDIREGKGIKKHLSSLSDRGLLQKIAAPPKSGKPNVWKPSGFDIDMFRDIWKSFPEEVWEPLFFSRFVQGFIQEMIVPEQVELFEYTARELDEKQRAVSRPETQYVPIMDRGIEFKHFISRSYELSPSLTIGYCVGSNEVWSLYSLSSAILDYSSSRGASIVKQEFGSPLGQNIYLTLTSLIVDMSKHPNKLKEIARFLIEPNTREILSIIFTQAEETMLMLMMAQIGRNLDVEKTMEGMTATELDKFAVAKGLVEEYISNGIRRIPQKTPKE